jgi:hypothetical protein
MDRFPVDNTQTLQFFDWDLNMSYSQAKRWKQIWATEENEPRFGYQYQEMQYNSEFVHDTRQ